MQEVLLLLKSLLGQQGLLSLATPVRALGKQVYFTFGPQRKDEVLGYFPVFPNVKQIVVVTESIADFGLVFPAFCCVLLRAEWRITDTLCLPWRGETFFFNI